MKIDSAPARTWPVRSSKRYFTLTYVITVGKLFDKFSPGLNQGRGYSFVCGMGASTCKSWCWLAQLCTGSQLGLYYSILTQINSVLTPETCHWASKGACVIENLGSLLSDTFCSYLKISTAFTIWLHFYLCPLFNCFQVLYHSMEKGLLKSTVLTTQCKKGSWATGRRVGSFERHQS